MTGFLGLYWPLTGEVDLRKLKLTLNLPVALPATLKEGVMSYHEWGMRPLSKDLYGIPSPINEPAIKHKDISILLVPALAIDHHGYRLGYGGGYFDRLRSDSNWRSIPSLVILPRLD